MRLPLNHDWTFYPDARETTGGQRVDLPHNMVQVPYNYFSHERYERIGLYKKNLPDLSLEEGERLFLKCYGIMAHATVFLNDRIIGTHAGGYTAFELELTADLAEGDNELSLRVDATENPAIPPFGHVVDFLTYGGIYREVELIRRKANFVASAKIETARVLNPEKEITLRLQFDRRSEDALRLVIRDENGVVFEREEQVKHREETLTYTVGDLTLWSPEDPHLYTLEVHFLGAVTHHRFGVRDVRFTDGGFYLNGNRIKLRGLNRHQSFPYVGYAMPRSAQEKDAEILKYDLACNVVRTSHYPQSRHFLNRCDEIGLLVFEEIPGWQHIGDEDWKALALTHVREMITEDWNHPSIILWGVRINESPDDDAFYAATNDLARRLDGTRPTGGVRNFARSHVFEDVYTYNDFVHTGENRALDPPEKITGKQMPYLVTEHNGHMFPTKKFDDASKRLEQALRHARVLDEMYRSGGISGTIGWCLFDYNTHRDFGSGDSICHHGVLDMFRIPKLAASVYSTQGTERPVLEISSNMEIGEYPGGLLRKVYAFTNCDAVDLYKNGTFIKRFTRDEKLLPGLPKSPIPIDDLIGNRLHDQEPFSEKDADLLKEILLKVGALGLEGLSLKDKAKMGYVMAKNRLTMEDGARLFTTYIGNWGGEAVVYRFVGILADEEVITVEKGPSADLHLQVSADRTHLIHGDTYDVSRVVIRAVDAYGSDALYYDDVITAAVTGPLEILGPSTVSLIGGSRALWVRSTGAGTSELTLTSSRLGERTLTFAVDLSEPTWRA